MIHRAIVENVNLVVTKLASGRSFKQVCAELKVKEARLNNRTLDDRADEFSELRPANIHERDGRASLMLFGDPAWHGLGTVLDKPATAAEAIQTANLDWTVAKKPLFAGDEHRRVPDRFAVVREDDWKKDKPTFFGIVGADYTVLQNRDAFRFFDPIVGEHAAVYHTAGALGNGERVWVLAKLPDDIRVIGDDITNKYLLLSNSHDGNSAVQIKFTPIRVVCQNTLIQALSRGPTLRAAHKKDLRNRLETARTMLGLVRAQFGELESACKRMAQVQVDQHRLHEYFRRVFAEPRLARMKNATSGRWSRHAGIGTQRRSISSKDAGMT